MKEYTFLTVRLPIAMKIRLKKMAKRVHSNPSVLTRQTLQLFLDKNETNDTYDNLSINDKGVKN